VCARPGTKLPAGSPRPARTGAVGKLRVAYEAKAVAAQAPAAPPVPAAAPAAARAAAATEEEQVSAAALHVFQFSDHQKSRIP
jgi:hypothetical protein